MINLTPDQVNGLFELAGAAFLLNHCRVLYAQKHVAGVSIISTVFFFWWAAWNIFYYPHLNQIWSFYGGLCIGAAHILYVTMLLYYRKFPGGRNSGDIDDQVDSSG